MSSTDTILGFPRRFNSYAGYASDPNNVLQLLKRLWTKTEISIDYDQDGEFRTTVFAHFEGGKIILPNLFPYGGNDWDLVQYLQDLLDLNGYDDLIVILDHTKTFEFEILYYQEFMERIIHPISEYRADMNQCDAIPIQHPNIEHTWIWVARKVGKLFPPGNEQDFDHDSICWRSCHA